MSTPRPTKARYEQCLASLTPYAPTYWHEQILRGIELSGHQYTPPGDSRYWDDQNFIVDWDEGSLSGGLGELAVMMSGKFDQRLVRVCLSYDEQHVRGYDFEYCQEFHQVKSGIVVFGRGAIKVEERHFATSAKWIHLITLGTHPTWYMGQRADWHTLIERRRSEYEAEDQRLPKEFMLEPDDFYEVGIREYPIFSWASK